LIEPPRGRRLPSRLVGAENKAELSDNPTNVVPLRSRKPRGQGHERRAEILAAAKALFIAGGYEAFTTRKLAARVGLSQTGLYVYFKSKEELLDALCRQSFAALADEFRAAVAGAPESVSRLRALGLAYIQFGLTHPDEYRLTFLEGPGLQKMSPDAADLGAPMAQQGVGNQVFLLIRAELERLAKAGALRPLDLTVATHSVWFGLHGLVSTFIARPGYLKADRDALIGGLLDSLEDGLRATPL
jgi:AcrR family transcriptional regulator